MTEDDKREQLFGVAGRHVQEQTPTPGHALKHLPVGDPNNAHEGRTQ